MVNISLPTSYEQLSQRHPRMHSLHQFHSQISVRMFRFFMIRTFFFTMVFKQSLRWRICRGRVISIQNTPGGSSDVNYDLGEWFLWRFRDLCKPALSMQIDAHAKWQLKNRSRQLTSDFKRCLFFGTVCKWSNRAASVDLSDGAVKAVSVLYRSLEGECACHGKTCGVSWTLCASG